MMNQFLSWFCMHGYGVYLWPGYGLVMGALVFMSVSIKWQKKRTFRQLKRWIEKHAPTSQA